MDPHRNKAAKSSKDQRELQEEATRAPNTNPAEDQPATGHTRSDSAPSPRNHPIPQPVHPPFSPFPPAQLDRSMFQRRDVPPFSPLPVSHLYPAPLPTREPNHGFSPAFPLGTGAAIVAGGGMENTDAGLPTNRPIPKRRYTKRQPKSGSNTATNTSPTSSAKPSGVKKSKSGSSSVRAPTPSNEDSSARLERIARNLNAAMASVQANLAEAAAVAAHEAAARAAFIAANPGALLQREDSDEDEEEGRLSSKTFFILGIVAGCPIFSQRRTVMVLSDKRSSAYLHAQIQ
ncbi:hypothetical protein SBOR_8065 [Sclerotinia borealis F-4128]|uniref:Uncharacterized protein n=1 Tax=Sclerotinia borealis (strain F-4128) TaxID=1432307 RepID=W9C9M2_SCLBF|nr:hypothetical protein SBOR_8065 [Sclerotinia borealis F-4128]